MAINIGSDRDVDKKFPKETISKRKVLTNKIIPEHFEMTLANPTLKIKNLNYLWWMYHKGSKSNLFSPFMLIFEMNLLLSLGIITEEEINNLKIMLESQDADNYYMALLIIDQKREERIKIHGKWTKTEGGENTSKELQDLVINHYSEKVVRNYPMRYTRP